MNSNLQLIAKMPLYSAKEYAKFLSRYGIENIIITCGKTDKGFLGAVFADEDKYLDYSEKDMLFEDEEAQIVELLSTIEKFLDIIQDKIEEIQELTDIIDESENDE